jgi:hypothetical protein
MTQMPTHGKGITRFGADPLPKPTAGMGSGRPAAPSSAQPSTGRTLESLSPEVKKALTAVAQATASARAAGIPVAPEVPVQDPLQPAGEPPVLSDEAAKTAATTEELKKLLRGGPDNPLATDERRKAIEKRCNDMNIEDMFMKHEVQQRVPIRTGKIEATYRSQNGFEDNYISERMSKEGREMVVQHYMNTLATYHLVLMLVKLNDVVLPSHLSQDRTVDDKKFNEKLAIIRSYPMHLISDLSLNGQWFQERVLGLFKEENVKNG